MFNVTVDNIIEATADRKHDFSNLLKILHRETPDRPTLFEFFLNPVLEQKFSRLAEPPKNEQEYHASHVEAFRAAGYDYVTSLASSFDAFVVPLLSFVFSPQKLRFGEDGSELTAGHHTRKSPINQEDPGEVPFQDM